jgi:hypothetical protein
MQVPDPDAGVKKAPDPGYGSATLKAGEDEAAAPRKPRPPFNPPCYSILQ